MGWSACYFSCASENSLVPCSLEVSLITPTLSLVFGSMHIRALCSTSTGANNSRLQSCTSSWIAARLVGGVWRFITQGRNLIRPLPVCTLRPSPHLKYLSSLLPLLKVLCFFEMIDSLEVLCLSVCLSSKTESTERINFFGKFTGGRFPVYFMSCFSL